MTVIVRDLPYFDRETALQLGDRQIRIKPDQIIVWISIAEPGLTDLHSQAPRLPAILDTGCNHNLVIRRDQLMTLAAVNADSLARSRRIRILGREAAQLTANAWLHSNIRGQRDQFANRRPFLLELTQGIAVLPSNPADDFPRLPLLGLRALRWAKLRLQVDCGACHVTIRSQSRFGVFG